MKQPVQNMSQRRLTVSVIIPAYNRADLIAEAIDSCLQQTQLPDEIVVVDDGSTDNTAEVLARYGAPVVVVHQVNQGVSAARNAAIAKAKGDVLIFLDSDDSLLPRCIERMVRVLEEHPEVDIVYPDLYIVDCDGNRLIEGSKYIQGQPASGDVFAKLACRNVISLTSAMIRRSSLGEARFDHRLHCAEDYDLWRQLAVDCQFHYLDEPLANYRNHEAQVTVNSFERMRTSTLEVQRRLMAMPRFKTLSRRERAKAYTTIGIRHTEGHESAAARKHFLKSIFTDPSYFYGFALLGLSLLGNWVLLHALNYRRKILYGHVDEHISARIAERKTRGQSPQVDCNGHASSASAATVAHFCVTGTQR